MAAGTKIVLSFMNASGNNISYSYNYANPAVLGDDVKGVMNTMITNGEIFRNVPVSIEGAKIVVTTENEIDLSE